jgi:hypothetical protein
MAYVRGVSRLIRGSVVAAVAAAVFPVTAPAKTISGAHQVQADIPPRIDRNIGFIPVNTMGQLPAFRVYAGGGQWVRGPWVNFTRSGPTMSESLKLWRQSGHGDGTFSDRRLTRAERRQFVQVADFGRDADVLVVKRDHPACAGLTLTQARAIAKGQTTKWSQVAATPSGSSDTIALRHVRFGDGAIEPRFGVSMKLRAGKATADGGIGEAAGNGAVAGITSWSRVRYRSDVCAVPIGGIAPTDVSVHGLTYPAAYPVGFVAPKKVLRKRYEGKLVRLFAKFFESERAAKLLRATGLLIKKDTPQSPGSPISGPPATAGPGRDAEGRPITPIRDDAAASSALTGERLEPPGSPIRWAFDPGGVFRLVDHTNPDACTSEAGRWSLLEGWRYSENGGGVIARVQTQFESAQEFTIELPSSTPEMAYVDGQQYTRSRSLPGTC